MPLVIPRELCRPEKCLKPPINAQRHLYESTISLTVIKLVACIDIYFDPDNDLDGYLYSDPDSYITKCNDDSNNRWEYGDE